MSSFNWFLLASGVGIGFCVGFLVAAFMHAGAERETNARSELSDYDGASGYTPHHWSARSDEDDHPGDVERQGSMHVPRATARHSARPYDERYAGMDEGRLLD